MAKYTLLRKAKSDLRNIATYTAGAWSIAQADKYYAILMNACQQVADNPNLGKYYEGVANNLRGYRAGRHIIFFMATSADEVLIVRILHSQMDLKNRIQE